eukprot:1136132-Pelagomonas_calceolata.AAC.4
MQKLFSTPVSFRPRTSGHRVAQSLQGVIVAIHDLDPINICIKQDPVWRKLCFCGFREDIAHLPQDERDKKPGMWPGACPPKLCRSRQVCALGRGEDVQVRSAHVLKRKKCIVLGVKLLLSEGCLWFTSWQPDVYCVIQDCALVHIKWYKIPPANQNMSMGPVNQPAVDMCR